MATAAAERPRANPVWAELVQLAPVIGFASSFLLAGEVDLARAGPLFAVGAVGAALAAGAVAAKGHLQNPIALGTGIWLAAGAVVFGAGWEAGAAALAEARGAALFACALGVCVALAATSETGCVGARGPADWIRRTSLQLVVFAAAALVWSWMMRANLRLGSGAPFLALNLVRRAAILRGPT